MFNVGLRLKAHADHIIVGVGAFCKGGVFGRVEHAACGDHGEFDTLVVVGTETYGIVAIAEIADRHEIASHGEAFHAMWDAAICGDELDCGTRAGFGVLGEFDLVLVGVANADMKDAGRAFGCFRPEDDEESADDCGQDDQTNGHIFPGGALLV